MVVRLVRAGVGALLLLIAVPLALAGGGLLLAMEHRAADDTFTARLERVRTDGAAVVVPDVDALLRADAPFARGGQTTLSLSVVGSGGPLFIGLGPAADVASYLDGVAQSRLTRVRLARGPLPVELAARAGRQDATAAPLPPPTGQLFWQARGGQTLTWSPSALRGRHLSLVIMRADGTAGIDVAITARLAPAWLGPTTGGLVMLGGALFLLAVLTLTWPPARRTEESPAPAIPAQPTQASRAEPVEPGAPEAEEEPAPQTPLIASKTVLATLADVLAAADAEAAQAASAQLASVQLPSVEPASAQLAPAQAVSGQAATAQTASAQAASAQAASGQAATVQVATAGERKPEPAADREGRGDRNPVLFAECELDRPAPRDAELDGAGPIELPPLPAMPAIELQFTWAPIALPEPAEDAAHGSVAR